MQAHFRAAKYPPESLQPSFPEPETGCFCIGSCGVCTRFTNICTWSRPRTNCTAQGQLPILIRLPGRGIRWGLSGACTEGAAQSLVLVCDTLEMIMRGQRPSLPSRAPARPGGWMPLDCPRTRFSPAQIEGQEEARVGYMHHRMQTGQPPSNTAQAASQFLQNTVPFYKFSGLCYSSCL